jgi:hypothetical protein
MRRIRFVILVLSLLLTLFYVEALDVPAVQASTIYQGDLVITGNNVTIIEGQFDINGSIIVEDNATLQLQNAVLNFSQTANYQYSITLNNALNGNPRLIGFNSTITSLSNYTVAIRLYDNSTATINNCTGTSSSFGANFNSALSISNNSYLFIVISRDSSVVNIHDSKIDWLWTYESGEVQVYDSEVDYFNNFPKSANCTISNLEPGFISYWNLIDNCSVNIQPGGSAPNVTLTDTMVKKWQFAFMGDSNATISNSTIDSVSPNDSSVLYVKSTTISDGANPSVASKLWVEDSIVKYVRVYQSANAWLLNSTYDGLYIAHTGKIYVSWYLDVTVEDSVGQSVPSSSVTVSYPNSTVVDSKLTDASGLARFQLMEKMVNATGEHPIGNYTVEATYDTHLGSTTVYMTETKQVNLALEFVIPEFSSLVLLSTFIVVTIAVVAFNRRYKRN